MKSDFSVKYLETYNYVTIFQISIWTLFIYVHYTSNTMGVGQNIWDITWDIDIQMWGKILGH